eukprot:2330660-Rhodomonas_salina.1
MKERRFKLKRTTVSGYWQPDWESSWQRETTQASTRLGKLEELQCWARGSRSLRRRLGIQFKCSRSALTRCEQKPEPDSEGTRVLRRAGYPGAAKAAAVSDHFKFSPGPESTQFIFFFATSV